MALELQETLTRKYGPLPGYAWVGIGGLGIVVLAKIAGGKKTTPAQGNVTLTPASTGDLLGMSGDGGGGGGSLGGGDGTIIQTPPGEPPPGAPPPPSAPPGTTPGTNPPTNVQTTATVPGSPVIYTGTPYAGDPAPKNAQPSEFGGQPHGPYAAPPPPGSNIHVPGLQVD